MSLPYRAAAIYVVLGEPPTGGMKPEGTGFNSYQDIDNGGTTVVPKQKQQNFYAYQDWFTEYPNELIAKVSINNADDRNYIGVKYGENKQELSYPDTTTIPAFYNPGPPAFDPVPNPLVGALKKMDYTTAEGGFSGPYPRYHTATAYNPDAAPFYTTWKGTNGTAYLPEKGQFIQQIGNPGLLQCAYSAELTVVNNLGSILNIQTGNMEYYPFQQSTTVWKADGKVIIKLKDSPAPEFCCWNDGTVVKGKIKLYSVDISGVPAAGYGPYGWHGIDVTLGSTFSAHSTEDWTVTVTSGNPGTTINIPRVPNKMIFAGDFWVTEVIPPS